MSEAPVLPRAERGPKRPLARGGARPTPSTDLSSTSGFLVADARGRTLGRVEGPMYGTSPDVPDALSVRFGFLSRRRRLVPAASIEQIDGGTKVIDLWVERDAILTFL